MLWFLWRNSVCELGKDNKVKEAKCLIWQYSICYSHGIGQSDEIQKNSYKLPDKGP